MRIEKNLVDRVSDRGTSTAHEIGAGGRSSATLRLRRARASTRRERLAGPRAARHLSQPENADRIHPRITRKDTWCTMLTVRVGPLKGKETNLVQNFIHPLRIRVFGVFRGDSSESSCLMAATRKSTRIPRRPWTTAWPPPNAQQVVPSPSPDRHLTILRRRLRLSTGRGTKRALSSRIQLYATRRGIYWERPT